MVAWLQWVVGFPSLCLELAPFRREVFSFRIAVCGHAGYCSLISLHQFVFQLRCTLDGVLVTLSLQLAPEGRGDSQHSYPGAPPGPLLQDARLLSFSRNSNGVNDVCAACYFTRSG